MLQPFNQGPGRPTINLLEITRVPYMTGARSDHVVAGQVDTLEQHREIQPRL